MGTFTHVCVKLVYPIGTVMDLNLISSGGDFGRHGEKWFGFEVLEGTCDGNATNLGEGISMLELNGFLTRFSLVSRFSYPSPEHLNLQLLVYLNLNLKFQAFPCFFFFWE
jgi:hypothetical protein